MEHCRVHMRTYVNDDATYTCHEMDVHTDRGIELSVEVRERPNERTLIIREAPDNDIRIHWGPPLLPLKEKGAA